MSPAIATESPTHAQNFAVREWRLDVSAACSTGEPLAVAATLVAPVDRTPHALLVCLPGGFLTRRYYNLEIDGDRSFGFGEAMAARGFATLALDHLGVGESSMPEDGWLLDADTLASTNQSALEAALKLWKCEREDVTSIPVLGVGHSMGSCLAVVQQANHAPFSGLVLFSFTTFGLPAFLQGRESEIANDPGQIRARIVELARERFVDPYPDSTFDGGHPAFNVGTAPNAAERALQQASTRVLPIPGLLAMIPGGYAPWAEQVRIPTLVAIGDHDLPGTEQDAIASLPNATQVDTFTLDDCWHCHFVANTRENLFSRVADWIDDSLPRGD